MHALPARPDLSQLRRQAKDLLRAAKAGDASALGRIRDIADPLALASAQLAVARERARIPELAEAEKRGAASRGPKLDEADPDVPMLAGLFWMGQNRHRSVAA